MKKDNQAFVDGQNLYKGIDLKYRADLGAEPVRKKIQKEKGSLGS